MEANNLHLMRFRELGCPRIEHLILLRSPTTIPRLIVTVVIYSVNREAVRFLAHVFKEAFESRFLAISISPSVANSNASTTIVRIVYLARVDASGNHRPVAAISWRDLSVDRMTMRIIQRAYQLVGMTAATSLTGIEARCVRVARFTAITYIIPMRIFAVFEGGFPGNG